MDHYLVFGEGEIFRQSLMDPISNPFADNLPPHLRYRPEWSSPASTKQSRQILRSNRPTTEAFLGLTREITSVKSGDTNKF